MSSVIFDGLEFEVSPGVALLIQKVQDDRVELLTALGEIAKRGANPITQYGYGKDKSWSRLADDVWRIACDAIANVTTGKEG